MGNALRLSPCWLHKPPFGTPLRRDGHPGVKDIFVALPLNERHLKYRTDCTDFRKSVASTGCTFTDNGIIFGGNSGDSIIGPPNIRPGLTTQEWSFVVSITKDGVNLLGSPYQSPFSDSISAVTINNVEGQEYLRMFKDSTAVYQTIVSNETVPSGRPTCIAGSGKHGVVGYLFIDGVECTYLDNGVGYGDPAPAQAARKWLLGASLLNEWAYNFKGTVHWAFSWSRLLSKKEIKDYSSNPWQLFEPRRHSFWHGADLVNDCKVKTVAPIISRNSWHGASICVPRPKVRPAVFELDYTHPLAEGLVLAGLGANYQSRLYYDSSLQRNHGTIHSLCKRGYSTELGRQIMASSTSVTNGAAVVPQNLTGWSKSSSRHTISFWARLRSTGWYRTMFMGGDWYNYPYFFPDDGVFAVGFRASGDDGLSDAMTFSSAGFTFNKWYHFLISWNGSSIKHSAWLNNKIVATRSGGSGEKQATSSPLYILGRPGAYTDADIADFMWWVDRDLGNSQNGSPEISLLSNKADPFLDGLIREKKNRTFHCFSSKFNIAGAQDRNNLKFEWGGN